MSEFDATLAEYVQCLVYYLGIFVFAVVVLKWTGTLRKLKLMLQSRFFIRMNIKISVSEPITTNKKLLFQSLTSAKSDDKNRLEILEVGAGDCRNFQYYPDNSRLTVVEPNVNFHSAIRERAASVGAHIHLQDVFPDVAENLSHVADESIDAYVMTHVMCSVTDVEQTLAEAYRVLKKVSRLCGTTRGRKVPGF